jgi:hypothetical protein
MHSNGATASKASRLVGKAQQIPDLRLEVDDPGQRVVSALYHGRFAPGDAEEYLTVDEFELLPIPQLKGKFSSLRPTDLTDIILDRGSMEALTVAQLKDILSAKALKKSGNKQELIQRLLDWQPCTAEEVAQRLRHIILTGTALEPFKPSSDKRSATKQGQRNEDFIVEGVREAVATDTFRYARGGMTRKYKSDGVTTVVSGLAMNRRQPELRASADAYVGARVDEDTLQDEKAMSADDDDDDEPTWHAFEGKTATNVSDLSCR